MSAFKKEEDYWERLERLEAEAEGSSGKSSSPSLAASLLGNRMMGTKKTKTPSTNTKVVGTKAGRIAAAAGARPRIRSLQPQYPRRSTPSAPALPAPAPTPRGSRESVKINNLCPPGSSAFKQPRPFPQGPSKPKRNQEERRQPAASQLTARSSSLKMTSAARGRPLDEQRQEQKQQDSGTQSTAGSSNSKSAKATTTKPKVVADLLAKMLASSSTGGGEPAAKKKRRYSSSSVSDSPHEKRKMHSTEHVSGTGALAMMTSPHSRSSGAARATRADVGARTAGTSTSACGAFRSSVSGGLVSRPLKRAKVGGDSSVSGGRKTVSAPAGRGGAGEDDPLPLPPSPLSRVSASGRRAGEKGERGAGGRDRRAD